LLCNDRETGGYTKAVSRQLLGKDVPIAGQQSLNNAKLDYNNGNGVLSMWSVPRCYKQGSNDVSTEAEESPLLEAVTRKRLLKIQQAGKDLAGVAVICKLWRLAMAL
jgi:hypothetical protein